MRFNNWTRKALFFVIAASISSFAYADVSTIIVDPSSLSYDMSPTTYSNSPTTYSNASTTYANSETTYSNAATTYANSKNTYGNGKNGSKRILTQDNQYLGYYVTNDDGVTNFFGQNGKRFGYNPAGDTTAIFYTKGKQWCGVIGSYQNQTVLGLSQKCYYLLLSQTE